MARVNRTTGSFLVFGVVLLLATVTGTRFLINPAKIPAPADPPAAGEEQPVFGGAVIDIPGGVANLVPGAPGRVADIKVKEDQLIKAGEVILQLDDQVEKKKLQAAEFALAAATARLESAKEDLKEHKLKLVVHEHNVEMAKGALAKAETALTESNNQKDLTAAGRSSYLLAKQTKADAEKGVTAAEKALELVKSIDPALSLKEDEQNLKKAEADVQAGQASLDLLKVKAPFDGRVIALNIRVGEQFGPSLFPGSQPPIVFCPEGDLIARVEVDQERAYLVKAGQSVTLHDKSPSRKQQWTGTVERVDRKSVG